TAVGTAASSSRRSVTGTPASIRRRASSRGFGTVLLLGVGCLGAATLRGGAGRVIAEPTHARPAGRRVLSPTAHGRGQVRRAGAGRPRRWRRPAAAPPAWAG